ncbi:uncharacterized protein EDB91DRAFT_1239049 [Suillus paluster]|uniref:uncharacterized protein n=1 Tax=Suillus paluster TaxID=48578 RepID=UPI001B85D58A|nr:uncharacterized protein EDB91DRAFT_1239049 [Suillus paluster]KAG1730650.1 hypothetical protein EDB91DRAFT_1239049 [Suillus paluster]
MFLLPCQHSLQHYIHLIHLFGAFNGLCSSITESKHIKAIKEPWWHSSQYKALSQMLVTNQHLDKLAAAQTDFTTRGMLDRTCLSAAINALEDAEPEVNVQEDEDVGDVEIDTGPTIIQAHVELVKTPHKFSHYNPCLSLLTNVTSCTRTQPHPHGVCISVGTVDSPAPEHGVPLPFCATQSERPLINVFNSACSRFVAPSNLSGIGGMHREHIRACPAWRKEHPRYDCIFVNTNPDLEGMRGMDVARLPDDDTGMWMVQPAHHANNAPHIAIIHVDSIYRTAHLIPHYQTYDSFCRFYINKYADHHSFEIAS